jgi:hypothetical protein
VGGGEHLLQEERGRVGGDLLEDKRRKRPRGDAACGGVSIEE